jgi:hypothetical protein
VYRFRGLPLQRCLLGPLVDPPVAIGLFAPGLVLALLISHSLGVFGFLVTFGCWLVFFEARAYRAEVCAEASGVSIANIFRTYRIPWSEVDAVSVRQSDRFAVEKIVISRRRHTWFDGLIGLEPVAAYESVGIPREAKDAATEEIIAIAKQYGHDTVNGA